MNSGLNNIPHIDTGPRSETFRSKKRGDLLATPALVVQRANHNTTCAVSCLGDKTARQYTWYTFCGVTADIILPICRHSRSALIIQRQFVIGQECGSINLHCIPESSTCTLKQSSQWRKNRTTACGTVTRTLLSVTGYWSAIKRLVFYRFSPPPNIKAKEGHHLRLQD